MTTRSRKEALADYKRQAPSQGVYAVRCTASERVWVGASPNLHAARNREWFLLRHGDHRDRPLQDAWREFGEDAFAFEVLDTLDEDVAPVLAPEVLKEKRREWAARLGAALLL